jgi:hypothetical protein
MLKLLLELKLLLLLMLNLLLLSPSQLQLGLLSVDGKGRYSAACRHWPQMALSRSMTSCSSKWARQEQYNSANQVGTLT